MDGPNVAGTLLYMAPEVLRGAPRSRVSDIYSLGVLLFHLVTDAYPVFELDGVRIGIQICYDRKFPEGSRALAVQGAEVLFMPICAATYGETKLRDHTWDLPLRARAYENGTFVVAVNRAGDEDGRRHMGRSMVISPIGAEILCQAGEDEPELLVTTLDLDEVSTAQKSLPWWRDRRPELYETLVKA